MTNTYWIKGYDWCNALIDFYSIKGEKLLAEQTEGIESNNSSKLFRSESVMKIVRFVSQYKNWIAGSNKWTQWPKRS